MIARGTPRAGTGPRYQSRDIGDKGAHVMRAPTFAGASVIRRVSMSAAQPAGVDRGSIMWAEVNAPVLGAMVGLCWWHPDLDLEAAIPSFTAPNDQWLAFGDAVSDELLEQGYSLEDFVSLYVLAFEATNRVHRIVEAAQEQADFTDGASGQATAAPVTPATP